MAEVTSVVMVMVMDIGYGHWLRYSYSVSELAS